MVSASPPQSPFLYSSLPPHTNVKSEGVSSAPLPPPDSLFGPPPPLETTTGGSPGPQDPTNILAPVSSSTVSYVNHSHYYPTDLYSGYPVASVFSAAGAQKAALQPTRQRTKARSNAGKMRLLETAAPPLLLLTFGAAFTNHQALTCTKSTSGGGSPKTKHPMHLLSGGGGLPAPKSAQNFHPCLRYCTW